MAIPMQRESPTGRPGGGSTRPPFPFTRSRTAWPSRCRISHSDIAEREREDILLSDMMKRDVHVVKVIITLESTYLESSDLKKIRLSGPHLKARNRTRDLMEVRTARYQFNHMTRSAGG